MCTAGDHARTLTPTALAPPVQVETWCQQIDGSAEGGRFRDDWFGGLDSRAAFGRASEVLLREADLFVHNWMVCVYMRDEHPEAMAKRLGSATATPEHVALAGIVDQLKLGLDVLGKHYAGEAARNTA